MNSSAPEDNRRVEGAVHAKYVVAQTACRRCGVEVRREGTSSGRNRSSLVIKVMDESSAAKDSTSRWGQCMLNMSRFEQPPVGWCGVEVRERSSSSGVILVP
ncbi:hypothetical protein TNCV_481791 [Trichonephila clavipes]|nr:hypothetical protein TNCV_481791 [Trichonephila clavipes]